MVILFKSTIHQVKHVAIETAKKNFFVNTRLQQRDYRYSRGGNSVGVVYPCYSSLCIFVCVSKVVLLYLKLSLQSNSQAANYTSVYFSKIFVGM